MLMFMYFVLLVGSGVFQVHFFAAREMENSSTWTVEKRNTTRIDSDRDFDFKHEAGCLSIIVLGASGDLAKKKTFPALFNLYRQVYVSFVVSSADFL